MKYYYKYSLVLLVTTVLTGIFAACDDEAADGGTPKISYIRITDPMASDSLLVSAGQGQMIAIIGENLGRAQQLFFNDQRASLTATLVSNNSIIARVPAQIPKEVTNELKLIFANGKSMSYDFTIDISKPLATRMKSEFVNAGDIAIFYGDFFYEPIVVTFAGGAQAEMVSLEDNVIQVKVPVGAEPGPVTITSNFGVTETDFWFRDNRDVIASFDVPLTSGVWRGPANIVASDAIITPISGKFIRVNQALGAWPFFELYGGPAEGDIGQEAKNIPVEALINPGGYSLKFEINTLKSLTGATMRLHLGNADNAGMDAARQASYYSWEANIHTAGQWETVTIPWANVYKGFSPSTAGYSMFIYFHGPNALEHNFALDNIRVVPNTND